MINALVIFLKSSRCILYLDTKVLCFNLVAKRETPKKITSKKKNTANDLG